MTMIEKVAKAICRNHWPDESRYKVYMSAARVAIEAMRDIDQGGPQILLAGKQALFSCSEDPELEDARRCWTAMIDATLDEQA